jgi:CDP-diacylglycerol--glycerol-3-phosphate 3-phosphatidyltransferase
LPSIYDLKPKFQAVLRPLCQALATAGVTANQVTVAAILLSVGAGACIAFQPHAAWPLLALPVVLFLRMALNAIDGMLAREHDMKSSLGAMLNELGDVISDVALYLPIALVAGVNVSAVVIIVVLSVITEMAGVVAVQIGAERRYDGPMGKSDRAFFFGLVCLLLGFDINPGPWLDYLMFAVIALLCVTIINRARSALAEAH